MKITTIACLAAALMMGCAKKPIATNVDKAMDAIPGTAKGKAGLKTTAGKVDMYMKANKNIVPKELSLVNPKGNVPLDVWGNPYMLITPGPNDTPYDLLSYGADGKKGGTGADADIRLSEL